MINIYKSKDDIDDIDKLIELNDIYFNKYTNLYYGVGAVTVTTAIALRSE